MKWLIVLASLFVYGQVFGAGLCIPSEDGQEKSNNCIHGWKGITDYVAYSGALKTMLNKFMISIVYDTYINYYYWYGYQCGLNIGDPDSDPPEPAQGCVSPMLQKSRVNVSLANAFHETLKAANTLEDELTMIALALHYRQSRAC